ncbi:hypothetical protein [Nostoc sp. DedQUE07]|uniref:hypothetical protein n=1 Tax=Nostoc sp. DedQUE07 TaxID=3075392 RepID=UPI002AD5531A|nr:hypothetical protein [Nostoc sp. DedQUE07]MDZ8129457.1 hypothetical protein [Nostoc sp. DedQUE07]
MFHLSLPNIVLPKIEARDLIASTSLLISLFTAYWNILRGAKFVSPPLRWITFGRLPNHTLLINFPISITNIGSITGVIDAFYIEFTNLSNHKYERFYAWKESILIGQEFNYSQPEIPTPIALRSGESVVKYYVFHPDSLDFMYECGLHKISLYACINPSQKSVKLYEQNLNIDSVLNPSTLPNEISLLFSYNLIPTKILRVSNYGVEASVRSIIHIAKG